MRQKLRISQCAAGFGRSAEIVGGVLRRNGHEKRGVVIGDARLAGPGNDRAVTGS